MENKCQFHGIIPAMPTPLTPDRKLYLAGLHPLINHYMDNIYPDGLMVNGASAECGFLSLEERKLVLEGISSLIGGHLPIMAHIGGVPLLEAEELAIHASNTEVDAISAVFPAGAKEHPDQAFNYLEILAGSTDKPFFLYLREEQAPTLIPERYAEQLRGIPNLVGMKYTANDIPFLREIIRFMGEDFIALTGHDMNIAYGFMAGTKGAIGTNFSTIETFRALFDHLKKSKSVFLRKQDPKAALRNQELALALHAEAVELIYLYRRYGVLASNKALLTRFGVPMGPTQDGTILTDQQTDLLLERGQKLGIFKYHRQGKKINLTT